ncbi:MAG: helix-turn-helix domain-containing protein [Flavobacterium sp.]|nr:helix-turn-helix domain-containing protein [Flavobacterium sp.]
MKSISILVPKTAVTAAIVDAQYMFTSVNQFLTNEGKAVPFKVQLVGVTKTVELNQGTVSITTDITLDEHPKQDLIIVPPIGQNISEALDLNSAIIPWLQKEYKKGVEIASLCIGAFLLAETGLLDNKSCSTHWMFVDALKNRFPNVDVVNDLIITEENGLYTSGGATSYWNLLLHLVEKYTNKETAILISKFFLLDINKNSQNAFTIFKGQRKHDDTDILNLQNYIETSFDKKISIEELANRCNLARRTLERRFKKATNNTVIEYMQRVKIEVAKKELENGRKTITEIMYEVGYSDSKSFRDVFKKYTSMSPIDYKKKYN